MIQTTAVLGAGTMGHAIANNLASHGIPVHLYESFDKVRKTVKDRIRAELEVMVQEEYFPEENIQKTLDNITVYADLAPAVKDVDFIIETLPENLDLKKQILSQADAIAKPETILATNTSSLKLKDIIADLPESRPERDSLNIRKINGSRSRRNSTGG